MADAHRVNAGNACESADSSAGAADPAARHAFAEQKIAAVNELIPFVLLMPRGIERARFEETIARRVGVSLQALRDEIAVRERSAPNGNGNAAAGGCATSRRRRRQSS